MLHSPVFHPWFDQLVLVAGNRTRRALRVWPQTLFVLAAWLLLIAGLAYLLRYVDADSLGVFIDAMTHTPLITGAALAIVGFLATRVTAVGVRTRLQLGWWGAMPIAPGATERSVVLCAVLSLTAALLLVLLPIYGVASMAALWEYWLPQAVRLVWISVPLGGVFGYLASRRVIGDHGAGERRYTYGKPLFAPQALHGGAMAQLSIWQRAAATRRWRSGGRAWLLGFVVLLLPANTAGFGLFGLVLLVVVAVWFGLIVQTAGEVVVASAALLRATPMRFAPFARASFRYAAFAVVCAGAWGALALLLQGASWKFSVILLVLFAAYATLQLALSLRFRAEPRQIRLRLTIESIALIATLQALGPVVIGLYAVLVGRHLYLAQKSA